MDNKYYIKLTSYNLLLFYNKLDSFIAQGNINIRSDQPYLSIINTVNWETTVEGYEFWKNLFCQENYCHLIYIYIDILIPKIKL